MNEHSGVIEEIRYVFILDDKNNNINNLTDYNNCLVKTRNGEQKTSARESEFRKRGNGSQKVDKIKGHGYNPEFISHSGIFSFGLVLSSCITGSC